MAPALRTADSNISGVNQKVGEIKVTICIVNQLSNKTWFCVKPKNFCHIPNTTCFDPARLLSGYFDKNLFINFPGGRRLKREAGHLRPCSADVKNVWSYTSAPYLPPWCEQGKFTFNFFTMTCYFRSKHADFAVENKETIIEVVFDWQEHIGQHAASVIRCACLWANGQRKPSGHSFNMKHLSIAKNYESPALNI